MLSFANIKVDRSIGSVIVATIALTIATTFVGIIWLSILISYASQMIEFIMWTNIFLCAAISIVTLTSGQLIGALIFGGIAMLNYCYLQSVRPRIPFASAVLSAACKAMLANFLGINLTSLVLFFCQITWMVLVSSATYFCVQYYQTQTDTPIAPSPVENGSNSSNNIPPGVLFLLLVSGLWGAQVLTNILSTTVAGTVACWFFQPQREAPVRGSLFRSLTASLGSICLGSLLVAVVQALRELLHMIRSQAHRQRSNRERNFFTECLIAAADCLLGIIERVMVYFNLYAYCYIAAYGLDFLSAGKKVTSLFARRGWTGIINDDLISRTMLLCVLSFCVVSAALGAMLSLLFDLFMSSSIHNIEQNMTLWAIVGLVVGASCGFMLTNNITSAVAMIFVCFAEDPSALKDNHYREFNELWTTWQQIYPESLNCFVGLGVPSSSMSSSLPTADPVMTYAEPLAPIPRRPANHSYMEENTGRFPHHAVPVQEYGYPSSGSYHYHPSIPSGTVASGGMPYNHPHSNHYQPYVPNASYNATYPTSSYIGNSLPNHYDESERQPLRVHVDTHQYANTNPPPFNPYYSEY